MITHDQFQHYAADGHTRIPVVREVLSDLDTPLSVYLKLADAPHTYLFESVEGGERFGRYSIIGLPAERVDAFHGHTLTVRDDGEVIETREVDDPLRRSRALRAAHSVPQIDGLPGFTGGLVGWFGFECIGYIEPRLARPARQAATNSDARHPADAVSEELAVFDNLKGRLYLVVHADPREPQAWERAQPRLDALTAPAAPARRGYPETPITRDVLDECHFVSGFTREGFIDAVEQVQGIHPRRRRLPGRAVASA